MQDSLRRKINELKEKKGKDADFNDLVKYIELQAKYRLIYFLGNKYLKRKKEKFGIINQVIGLVLQ